MVSTAPDNLHDRLPADAYYHLARTLCLTLPPPPSDHPEALVQRNHAAIARVAALVPANAAEADLAALFVIASEQCKDCVRLAELPATPPDVAVKCRAQALSMMREAKGFLRLLLQLQAVRGKREANSTTCSSAAWTEHCAIGRLGEGLPPLPAPRPVAASSAPIPEPPAPMPAPQPEPEPVEEFAPDPVAEAEHYAALYPERAALIRRLGRVPAGASFGPPDADLVQALITARTPALAALDREFATARAA